MPVGRGRIPHDLGHMATEAHLGITDGVWGLLARGATLKQIARELGLAVKTVDRHAQNIYGKIDVSTRAAATLFAVENHLLERG